MNDELTYVQQVAKKRDFMICSLVAEAMNALKQVGDQIAEIGVLCGNEHTVWLEQTDTALGQIWSSSKDEFMTHYKAAFPNCADDDRLAGLRELVEMIGNL